MISGTDLLKFAQSLVLGNSEVEWRCAVSRAYYAAFHEARQLLQDLGFIPPRGDQAHAYLWLRLSNSGESHIQLAGSDLNTLRRERNRADYDIDQALSHPHAQLQVQASSRIITTLLTARREPIRGQVLDAMRIYERDVLRQVTWQP